MNNTSLYLLTRYWPNLFLNPNKLITPAENEGPVLESKDIVRGAQHLIDLNEIHDPAQGQTVNDGFPKLLNLFYSWYKPEAEDARINRYATKILKQLIPKSLLSFVYYRTYANREYDQKERTRLDKRFIELQKRASALNFKSHKKTSRVIEDIIIFFSKINKANQEQNTLNQRSAH